MTQQQSPLPVQPIHYAIPVDNPWRTVSRLCASCGIAIGCVRIVQVVLVAWPFLGRSRWPTGSAIVFVSGSLSGGIIGLLLLVGAVSMLRNPRSSQVLMAGCWTSIIGSAVMMVSMSIASLVEGYFGQPPIYLGFLLLNWGTNGILEAIWPLLTLLLLRSARRDPQFFSMAPG
ncbi:MAG: hypothetical protein ACHRHE_05310 [Tepidisphaerales bacterium]